MPQVFDLRPEAPSTLGPVPIKRISFDRTEDSSLFERIPVPRASAPASEASVAGDDLLVSAIISFLPRALSA